MILNLGRVCRNYARSTAADEATRQNFDGLTQKDRGDDDTIDDWTAYDYRVPTTHADATLLRYDTAQSTTFDMAYYHGQ